MPEMDAKKEVVEPALSSDPENLEETKEEWTDVLGSGDLKFKTLIEGHAGSRPQSTDRCYVKLSGELENGAVVEEENELVVELGASEVMQGLDLILSLLDVGQKVTAIIKPRFGYGKLGLEPKIPPDSTLIYTIELLKVVSAPEVSSLTYDERKERALFKKDKGNFWYKREDAQKAIQCYRAALDILQDSTPYTNPDGKITDMPEEVFRDFVQLKLVIYNNLGAAQMMIEAFDSAMVSVDRVLELEPKSIKALYRKGKILSAQGHAEEAVIILKKASGLAPANLSIKNELTEALKRQSLEKQQAKDLYKRMLGSAKPDETSAVSRRSPSDGISGWTKILGGAAATTIAAALAYGFKYKGFTFWE